MTTSTDIHALLKAHFGFDSFRGQQEAVVRRVLAGGDSLLLMPTGGGKSLCYQLPALAMDGVTLVISPLIALMKDQVDGLNANGIAARFINSTLPVRDVERVQAEVRRGAVKILYIAPERLALDGFRRFLSGLTVSLIAIDEAHCISEWGHEFRPDYRNLRPLREMFPRAPVLALTATATERVRRDIVEQLGLTGAEVFVSSFNRANLSYSVRAKDNVERQLPQLLAKWKGHPAIVYCFARQETEDVAAALRAAGFDARAYHAGLSAEDRRRAQEDFSRDRVPVIVATIAFGMGVDKPDVRLVVHTSLPKSVESYYQETGRAGRDGLPSECVLLYSYGDKMTAGVLLPARSRTRASGGRHRRSWTRWCSSRSCTRAGGATCWSTSASGGTWRTAAAATFAWRHGSAGSSTRRRSRRRRSRRWCGRGSDTVRRTSPEY